MTDTPTPRHTLTFDEAETWLSEVADEIPQELLEHLNGGIILLPDVVRSPHGAGLFTLGTYHNEPMGLGRYIVINYGSFVRVSGHQSVDEQKKALRQVLVHEVTHHIESLAGVRDLEVKDEIFLDGFAKKRKKGGRG